MFIKNINITNFRNYENLSLEFCDGVNVFTGDNAQGKTNVLEAIYYCSIGKSHRTNKDKELIRWGSESAFVSSYISKERLDKKIDIKIFKEGKKGIKINSVKLSKLSELIGVFNVVMFSPEDLRIIKGSPSNRRKLLDIEISKLSRKYYYNLVQYNKVLNDRNTVLRKWNGKSFDIIDVYDSQLSKFGSEIIKERVKYVKKLNEIGKNIHCDITSGSEEILFKYVTPIENFENCNEELLEKLTRSRKSDIERRTTLVGPHREDFDVYINGINARNFGSQGQQRTAVLTIKFASLEIIKEISGEYPALLLDDVLSELDSKRQKYILNSVKSMQTIITSTGLDDISGFLDKNSKLFSVKNGTVSEISS